MYKTFGNFWIPVGIDIDAVLGNCQLDIGVSVLVSVSVEEICEGIDVGRVHRVNVLLGGLTNFGNRDWRSDCEKQDASAVG